MWLLDARTKKLHFVFDTEVKFKYAILSHTWDGDEVDFQDIQSLRKARRKKGYQKIRWLCKQALEDGLNYAWIDTCCIDKTSSTELSEAINSMYKWYKDANVCYAYLSDVPLKSIRLLGEHDSLLKGLSNSRWFRRGWTLQEMIAPHVIKFYDRKWDFIGTTLSLGSILESITDVPVRSFILQDPGTKLEGVCAARIMSWAAQRKTTRPEDRAYSLLGIFDVNMPLLYGEGERKAFERLQLAILRSTGDLSLLLWDRHGPYSSTLLAESPEQFRKCKTMVPVSIYTADARDPFEIVEGPNMSVRVTMAVVRREQSRSPGSIYAIFNYRCRTLIGPIVIPMISNIELEKSEIDAELVSTVDEDASAQRTLPVTDLNQAVRRRLLLMNRDEGALPARSNRFGYAPNRLAIDPWCQENLEFMSVSTDPDELAWRRNDFELRNDGTLFAGYLLKDSCRQSKRQIDGTDPRDFTLKCLHISFHVLFKNCTPTGLNMLSFCCVQLSARHLAPPDKSSIPDRDWMWLAKGYVKRDIIVREIDLGHMLLDIVYNGDDTMYIRRREMNAEKRARREHGFESIRAELPSRAKRALSQSSRLDWITFRRQPPRA